MPFQAADAGEWGAASFIAIPPAKPGGCASPFQIQAQILREQECRAPVAGFPGFQLMDGDPDAPKRGKTRSFGRCRPLELKRAIIAARQAGLQAYRIELDTDGMISIVVGESSAQRRRARIRR